MNAFTSSGKKQTTLLAGFVFMAALTSCGTQKSTIRNREETFKSNYCSPTVSYLRTKELFKEAEPVDLIKYHIPISAHDQLLCQILGISNDVKKMVSLKKENPNETTYLLLKQKITSRLLLAQSELSAVTAELDCEGERSDMAANYIDGLNSKRNRNLTVGSVVLGALTTVVTAVVKNNSVQTTVGISGGLVSAGLGALTINPKGKTIEYIHERNLLKSIWKTPETNMDYPDFVWKMLHEKKFSNNGDLSLAESIRNRWIKFEFDGQIDSDQEELLFGRGGYYRSGDLHTRASMTNQLQSTIRSVNQDLTSLVAFMEGL